MITDALGNPPGDFGPAASRTETDSFGSVELPANALYGAQTQRSLQFFSIGEELLPWGMVRALLAVKQACAQVNHDRGLLATDVTELIARACTELLGENAQAAYRKHFPVRVWQTGSGTQSNMNVNEVVANLANFYAGEALGGKKPVHPNDHVNRSQSSNDVFPTAMHLYAIELLEQALLPAVDTLIAELARLEKRYQAMLITGRTHLMDALPLTLGHCFGAYRHQLQEARAAIVATLGGADSASAAGGLIELAIGGTAVGSGANAPENFDRDVCTLLSAFYGRRLLPHPNKFAALSGQDALLAAAQALVRLASVLHKMANDIRLLASGPNSGIGELQLPANEPGSSIMPGKVNPTQCEAMAMVCMQVSAQVDAIEQAAAAGQLQLNTCRPMMIHNFGSAVGLLSDVQHSFASHCLAGISVNEAAVQSHLDNNLMLVTFAAPELGYDNASKIARHALEQGCNIYQAAEKLGIMKAEPMRVLVEQRVRESLLQSQG
ncbi:MAG: class II fumarate hydratase [Pseudomonadales bacterium]|nr:class II fumarate hydratase [Pseudomonadales bacterium]